MKKARILCLIFALAMLFTSSLGVISVLAAETGNTLIPKSDIPLRLWYDEEAPKINENSPAASTTGENADLGWAEWSLPIGNGYVGANVFGRTETERIQITEKTLMQPTSVQKDGVYYNIGGLNSFSETYIDFGHTNSEVTDYIRYLDMKTAISGVEYTYGGVKYTREYFTSYPDKALVIRLESSEDGALSFTLRPTVPYEQSYGAFEKDGASKTGTVTSKVNGGVGEIELSGKMAYYDIDFFAIYKVYTEGGTVSASTVNHSWEDKDGSTVTDTDGVISVEGARSAYIVVTLGSDYELTSEMFTSSENDKPTTDTDLNYTREKIGGYMNAIENKTAGKGVSEAYETLRDAHVADHSNLFGRVCVDFDCNEEDFTITTDELINSRKNRTSDTTYLDVLIFQYGRYLLIASSRLGALPANLQGAWNTYNTPPWASAYTHNINVEMNYWHAFSTNIAETFEPYVEYNMAYMEQAGIYADSIVNQYNPDVYGEDGGNGWVMGNHIYPYRYTSDRSAGNIGFITQVFWDYYQFTKDPAVLEYVYSILIDAARYITKCVEEDEEGNWLVSHCDSPEMKVNGVWYYTVGTTYAQTFAYLNNYYALETAKELGIDLSDTTGEDYEIIQTVLQQINKYDPINVGLSGQIKEFREETYYSSLGDDPTHRHVSQLVGLYPGSLVNSNTPAWLDAAEVVLENRGLGSMGWARAHRMNLWARVKNGNEAYKLLEAIYKDRTSSNLWTSGPPFQIDGNFGAAAGIAEMLLQSHEGYIAPLAALPDAWATGSYTGLVARGNFEVSAAWENGLAKTFNITSRSGGTASVYYPAIASAYVVDSEGNAVSFTRDGADLISFETEAGKTYIIYGFVAKNIPRSPSNLAITETSGTLSFTWDAVSGASSYNVYVAVENAADYTLIGTTDTNSFSYTPEESVKGLRTTYAVTAVGEGESKRALTYTVETVVTEYGEIPASSAGGDATFAIFARKKGATTYKFIETGSLLVADGLDKARQYLKAGGGTYQGGEIVIYLLKDYTSKGTASGAGWNSAFQINGTLTVDLGGKKLTSTAPRFIGVEAKESGLGYNYATNIVIKNGTFCTAKPIVELFGDPGQYTGNKVCSVTCTGVTFTPNGTPSSLTMFEARGSYSSAQKAAFDLTFNNCDFNFPSLTALNVVKDSCGTGAVSTSVEISDGDIRASSFAGLGVLLAQTEDSLIFTKPSTGSRTEFTVKYTSTAPTLSFNTDDGVKHLASATIDNATEEESKRTTTYRLSSFKTPYGYVPENLKDKAFSLFYNGLHIGSYGVYLNAEKKVQELFYPKTNGIFLGEELTLYMLKDYEHSDVPYDNFAQIDGTLVLDLGGKTLSMKSNSLFYLAGKAVNGTVLKTTYATVKNGCILMGASPLAIIESNGTSGNFAYNGTKSFDFTFEGVTFGKLESASSYSPLFKVGRFTETTSKNVYLSADFNGCSITSGEGAIFDLSVSSYVDADIKINGGSLTAPILTESSLLLASDSSDTLTFGKYGTEYTSFILPKSLPAPTLTFSGGDLILERTAESDTAVTYTLREKTLGELGFEPKMSVTLESSLVLNVYVPKDGLVSFKLGETEYNDLNAIDDKLVTVSGKSYYKLEVINPASRCAKEIELTAVASAGGKTASGTFTFSIIGYCSEIISLGEYSEIERTLARDILAYVRSAYVYFDSADKATVSERIDGILGDRSDTLSKCEGKTETEQGLHSALIILLENPVIRFYLSEGGSPEDYTFTVNGEVITPYASATAAVGEKELAFVDLSLHAYQLISEIDYTVGSYEGSYHINSYCDFITTDEGYKNDAALTDIVEALYRYASSAAAYKASLPQS